MFKVPPREEKLDKKLLRLCKLALRQNVRTDMADGLASEVSSPVGRHSLCSLHICDAKCSSLVGAVTRTRTFRLVCFKIERW